MSPESNAQLATEYSIRIGHHALTLPLARRISQNLRNLKSSPAIAKLISTSKRLHSGPDLALYDFKLQLLDGYLIFFNQIWIKLPPALFDVLGIEHMATLFNSAHGCCLHVAHDKDLAFISHMGIDILGRNRERRFMCVEINYACRCRTIFECRKCPSKLIFSRHELRDGQTMPVTTNWRNMGDCQGASDGVWRSQTMGIDLLSTASHQGQSRFDAPEWKILRGRSGMISYEIDTTSRMREVADETACN
jgi:hypothetical protein